MTFASIPDALTQAETWAGNIADALNYAEVNETDPAKVRVLKRAHRVMTAAAEAIEDAYGVTGAPLSNPRPLDGQPK